METVVAGKLNWACSFGRSLDVGGHNLLPVLEALGRVTVALTESGQKPIKDSSDQLEDAGRDTRYLTQIEGVRDQQQKSRSAVQRGPRRR